MATNLGQVAGLHIGSSAPTNTNLIWFDNTPGVNLHKVYDFGSSQWVVLDQNLVISITYVNLVLLSHSQLTIGQWFKITDLGNLMAIALTSTIVQYTDVAGNIVLDDLGNSKQYIVTNNNLTIEDVNGVFNNDRLNFEFTPYQPDPNSASQFLMGVDKIGGVSTLIKIPITSLISQDLNNFISFGSDGGLFVDLVTAINNMCDVANGVVSYNTYINDLNNIAIQLNNMNNAISSFQNSVTGWVLQQVSDVNIYSKRIPAVSTAIAPSDIIPNDTLQTIVNKTQIFINKFKTANGIDISPNFTDNANNGWVNNNDTVESAIEKIQYILKHISTIGNLSANWQPENFLSHINDLQPLDTFDTAFAKLQGKLNQIGFIENGEIRGRGDDLVIDMFGNIFLKALGEETGIHLFNNNLGGGVSSLVGMGYSHFMYDETSDQDGLVQGLNSPFYIHVKNPRSISDTIAAAITAKCEPTANPAQFFNDNVEVVDAFFENLKSNSLSVREVSITDNQTIYSIGDETSLTLLGNCNNITVTMPDYFTTPTGRIVILRVLGIVNNFSQLTGNGANILMFSDPAAPMITLENAVYVFQFCVNNNTRVWYGIKLN